MAHYRSTCQKSIPECRNYLANTVVDKTVLRFRKQLVPRVLGTLGELGFLRRQDEGEEEEEEEEEKGQRP